MDSLPENSLRLKSAETLPRSRSGMSRQVWAMPKTVRILQWTGGPKWRKAQLPGSLSRHRMRGDAPFADIPGQLCGNYHAGYYISTRSYSIDPTPIFCACSSADIQFVSGETSLKWSW